MRRRLAQAARQDIAVVEGAAGVQKNDVQITVQLPELKRVIQNDNVRLESLDSHLPAEPPIFADEDGDAGEQPGQQGRFISRLFGPEQKMIAIGDDARPAVILAPAAVAARQKHDAPSAVLQCLRHQGGHRSFAGAA